MPGCVFSFNETPHRLLQLASQCKDAFLAIPHIVSGVRVKRGCKSWIFLPLFKPLNDLFTDEEM